MPRDPQPAWVAKYRQLVGVRVRDQRVYESRTQMWVCGETGIGRTHYQAIESGQRDARIGDLALIAQALRTTVAALTDVPIPPA